MMYANWPTNCPSGNECMQGIHLRTEPIPLSLSTRLKLRMALHSMGITSPCPTQPTARARTPVTFWSLSYGGQYTLTADSYGGCNFSYWSNTGTGGQDTVYVNDTQVTAYFTGSGCHGSGGGGGSSSITVDSENQNDQSITGYYTTLTGNGTESKRVYIVPVHRPNLRRPIHNRSIELWELLIHQLVGWEHEQSKNSD